MSRHWGPNFHDNLTLVKKIGQGGEGSAFLMRRSTDRTLLVCKVSHEFAKWKNTDRPREAKILCEIVRDHPRILKMLHFEITRRMEFMAFYDYCAGGDLREMMVVDHDRIYHGGTSARVLWHVFIQLAEALAFLHYGFTQLGVPPPAGWRHIIHCDLKPENIFLKTPYRKDSPLPDLVLGDFGFANAEQTGQSEEGGTWAYMPPEHPLNSQYGDVWALGCTIHALVHGVTPYRRKPDNFLGDERAWNRDPRSRKPQRFPELYRCHELNDAMLQCLRRTWNNRPHSDDLLTNLRFDFEATKVRR